LAAPYSLTPAEDPLFFGWCIMIALVEDAELLGCVEKSEADAC